jgi:hypothetical protein
MVQRSFYYSTRNGFHRNRRIMRLKLLVGLLLSTFVVLPGASSVGPGGFPQPHSQRARTGASGGRSHAQGGYDNPDPGQGCLSAADSSSAGHHPTGGASVPSPATESLILLLRQLHAKTINNHKVPFSASRASLATTRVCGIEYTRVRDEALHAKCQRLRRSHLSMRIKAAFWA